MSIFHYFIHLYDVAGEIKVGFKINLSIWKLFVPFWYVQRGPIKHCSFLEIILKKSEHVYGAHYKNTLGQTEQIMNVSIRTMTIQNAVRLDKTERMKTQIYGLTYGRTGNNECPLPSKSLMWIRNFVDKIVQEYT